MCGRYAMALRPSQIRQMLEDDGLEVDQVPDDEGEGAPRSSYNFAPGYHGVVYRADTPDRGAGPHDKEEENHQAGSQETGQQDAGSIEVKYKLQSMKWGLIPFWTKRTPDYGSMLKTINCRDDSLSSPGGMWASMKARKRCIVVAQGFYEWLKTSNKDKLPHYVKRKDGHLMCFAGLWDCVQYEGSDDRLYTYTVITTSSNKHLKFLHDRMPVILDTKSSAVQTWLDPSRHHWSHELQSLLKPFDGDLEVYQVIKDVGKVGNNSPSFIIPLDSKENKSNIVNFFANSNQKHGATYEKPKLDQSLKEETREDQSAHVERISIDSVDTDKSLNAKRKAEEISDRKEPTAESIKRQDLQRISAISNKRKDALEIKARGAQKITSFFS
ncbi:hypothetical protein FZEAL_5778 [Fusarium zealandicum]|uniref:DUF159 domain protein n=1 Tax=Fusarium zealandicum TaxID=1053134 RepID=A0A8H4UJS2_9HYPO|nr:hypothetical protein FZEAL_5778 [Fusarium zealandicum]